MERKMLIQILAVISSVLLAACIYTNDFKDKVEKSDLIVVGEVLWEGGQSGVEAYDCKILSVLKGKIDKKRIGVFFRVPVEIEPKDYIQEGKAILFLEHHIRPNNEEFFTAYDWNNIEGIIPYSKELEQEIVNIITLPVPR